MKFNQIIGLQTIYKQKAGTAESTISLTEWHANKPLKTKITEGTANIDGTLNQALRITTFAHDERGNILTKTIADTMTSVSRTWTYTYNSSNQKLIETTPQGLTTTWVYDDANSNMLSVTDSQGLIMTYSNHNLDGKPQTITSTTGQVTTIIDDAGRVLTQSTTITPANISSIAQVKDSSIVWKNKWRGWFNMPCYQTQSNMM